MDFTGKLVVITGVGRAGQAGEAIALSFAQRGATLALLDLQQAEVEARVASLVGAGYPATAHAGNLADANGARDIVAALLATHHDRFDGAVHAVVCAAGGFGATGPLDESDPDAWHRQFMINLHSAYGATRAFLPAVRKGQGSFVYFASVAALPGGNPGGLAAYAAAKGGLVAMMRSVANDEKKNGVRANAVAPVAIRTSANIASSGDKDSYVDRESVADVVQFLCSHYARNVSGQVITLA